MPFSEQKVINKNKLVRLTKDILRKILKILSMILELHWMKICSKIMFNASQINHTSVQKTV